MKPEVLPLQEKKHKGFWLEITLQNKQTKIVSGITSKAEAEYLIKRRYQYTPNIHTLTVYINQTKMYTITYEKGITHMSKFSDYRENVAKDGKGGLDSVPMMKSVDRSLFIKGCVPFFVTSVEEVTTQYGLSLVYQVVVDIESKEYIQIGRALNIQSEYSLWVKATSARKAQRDQLMKSVIEDHERLVLIDPPEGAWDFDLYEAVVTA